MSDTSLMSDTPSMPDTINVRHIVNVKVRPAQRPLSHRPDINVQVFLSRTTVLRTGINVRNVRRRWRRGLI